MPTRPGRAVARSVLALVMLLAASVLTVAPFGTAHAAASAPTGLTAAGSPIPTFSWARVPGATSYRVQGAENSSFSSLVFNQETANTSYTPPRLMRSGTLHWRVQAVDPTGWSEWSQGEVSIGSLTVPANLTVSGGEAVLPPVAPPVISWDPVPGATAYDIEMDPEGDGVGGHVRTNLRTTTYVWPDPQGVGENQGTEDFFVRVRAKFENNLQSDWSSWQSYDVQQLAPVTSESCAPGLICAPDPTDGIRGSVTVQDVVFDWDHVDGATQYEIWVALDRDFNTQVEKRRVYSTRYSPTTTYGNNNYFWKVRAYNAAGQPTPWPAAPSEFQRRWPMAPSLVHPPVTMAPPVADDLYFQWTPVRHASWYALEVGSDVNFSPGSYSTCRTASTTYTPGFNGDRCIGEMPQGTLVYWRVRALDAPHSPNVEGVYSETGHFVYDSGRVPQVSPAPGSTVAVPTLRWAPSQDAAQYLLTIDPVGTGDTITVQTSALSWTSPSVLPTDSDQADPAREPDAFDWTVQAVDANGQRSPKYPSIRFFLEEGPPAAGASPLAPLDQPEEAVTTRFPSLAWQPIASTPEDRVYYRLKVAQAGYVFPETVTGVLRDRLSYPAVTDTSTFFLTPGTRDWWVEAYDAKTNALLATGPRSSFTIDGPGTITGHQVALDGAAVDAGATCSTPLVADDDTTVCTGLAATPVLDWEDQPGAGGYLVYVAEDPDFTNWVYRGVPTQNSRWTPSADHNPAALPDNESGPAYYWYVRPCVSTSPIVNCGPDPSGVQDVGSAAFRKVSPRVALTSPAPGATFADQVTFAWTDYHLTNQSLEPAFDAGGVAAPPYQTAMRYRLQVAQSATIADGNTIDDVMVDQATYTAFTRTYPEGDLWWRVQPIDPAGNRLSWSQTRKLVKATPAENLDPTTSADPERPEVDPGATPAFNSHLSSGDVLFQWTARDMDARWEIEVYRNDDTTQSGAYRVLSERTSQAAYAPSLPLTPSSEPYRWRIRRTDVAGALGRWSDFGRFWVDPVPVTLTSPTADATVSPNGPSLAWQALASNGPQATRYVVDVEPVANGGTNPGPATTMATSWQVPIILKSGAYTWTVKAYDTNGGLLGTSSPRGFTVDGDLAATSQVRVLAPGGSAVGQTLTSVPPVWNQGDVQMSYQWLRNGSPIRNATADTYQLVVDDYGKAVSVRVTGRKPGYTDGLSTSNQFSVVAGGALQNTSQPLITGKGTVGETLTVTDGSWTPSASRLRYQWLRTGAPIPGATGRSYRLAPADAGTNVSVTVLASTNGFGEGAASAAAVAVAKLTSTTTITLSETRVRPKQRVKVGITVSVPGLSGPVGVIKVMDGSKKIKQVRLYTAKNGQVTVKLPRIKRRGKHKIRAVYLGNPTTEGSKSKRTRLSVVR